MDEGANVVTEGFGSSTMVTEGFAYTPRAIVSGAVRPAVEQALIGLPALLKLKAELANAFSNMRVEYGEGFTIEAIWQVVDNTVLSQPGIYERKDLSILSPLDRIRERERLLTGEY